MLHRLHGFTGAVLDAGDHFLDFLGRLRGAMGQRTHFVCHHGKATPGFTGTGRFNGGVERQQVGLLGNRADHVQHFADVAALGGQAFNHRSGVLYVLGHGLDRADGFHHTVAPFTGSLVGLAGRFGGGHRVARHFLHRRRHFVDRRGGLIDFIVLLLQAFGGFFGDRAQLFRCRGKLSGRAGDLLDGLAQVGLHGRQGAKQARRFVLAVVFDGFTQVATGDGFGNLHGFAQRRDNAAGQQPRQQHGEQCGSDGNCNDAGDRAVVTLPGFSVSGLGIGRVDGDELVQLLAHLVGAVLDAAVDQCAHLIHFALPGQREHVGLGLEVVVQRDHEGFVQRGFFRAGR